MVTTSSKQLAGGGFVTKWSTKPSDHKVNRVRNNQRRHREKVKSRVALLESTLSRTQSELQQALETIGRLRDELDSANALISAHGLNPVPYQDTRVESAYSSGAQSAAYREPQGKDLPLLTSVSSTGISEELSSYETLCVLKPPAPPESTTRCRDAFKIIAAQNFANVEPSAIRVWLEPGFRRAVVEGDGCRVDNTLLFALLDHINPG